MKPDAIVEKLWGLGFSIRAESGNLIITPSAIPSGLRALVASNKAAIIDLLGADDAEEVSLDRTLEIAREVFRGLPHGDRDRENLERAAIEAKDDPTDELKALGLKACLVGVWRRRVEPQQEAA